MAAVYSAENIAGRTIEEYLEMLTPEMNHGDRVAVSTLKSYAKQIADIDARMAGAEPGSIRYDYLAMERMSLLFQAQVTGFIAMCYQPDDAGALEH